MVIAVDASGIGSLGDFPEVLGRKLAEHIIGLEHEHGGDLSRVEIDVTHCPAGWLTSAYFRAFTCRLAKHGLRDAARQIRWRARWDFQHANIHRWVVLADQHVDVTP